MDQILIKIGLYFCKVMWITSNEKRASIGLISTRVVF